MTPSLDHPSWRDAKQVLCVRLDSMGDVLMTTPALRALKEGLAGRSLTLLTSPAGAEVATLVPEVDDVIVYDAPWLKATTPRSTSALDLSMIDRLRARHFDASVIFTVFTQNPLPSAMLCYLADIPLRASYCRENPYQLLTDWLPETDELSNVALVRHEVQRQLELAGSLGCFTADDGLSLCLPQGSVCRVDKVLSETGVLAHDKWLVLHPGASASSRRYSPLAFAEAARQLAQLGWHILLTGTQQERVFTNVIQEQVGACATTLAGQLALPELAALIGRAPILITNNTGPAHIAAAMGTPVVDVYALTNPQHTPWGVPNRVLFHDVPCKYCLKSVCPERHHNCLRLVDPSDIVRAVQELAQQPIELNQEEIEPCLPSV